MAHNTNKTSRELAVPPLTPERKQRLKLVMLEHVLKRNEEALHEHLDQIISSAMSLIRDVRRYQEQMRNPEPSPFNTTSAEYFSWAINAVENFNRNVNHSQAITMATRWQAAFSALEAAKGTPEENN